MNKYDSSIDPDVNLLDTFLPLTYFQQWVLFDLYFAKKYGSDRPKSAEDLIMNACMSAMVNEFDEEIGRQQLTELAEKGLITAEDDTGYRIAANGTVLVRSATGHIHDLMENPDFESLIGKITEETVKANLIEMRESQNFPDTEAVVKEIIRLFKAHIRAWVQLVVRLSSDSDSFFTS